MNDSLRTKNLSKVYMSLFPIQALAAGLPAINALLDSLIIGNFIGTVGLAIVGFISPLLMLVNAIAGTVSSGSQLMCGQAVGHADNRKINGIYTVSILMCLILGIPMTVLTQLIPEQIATILGAGGEYLAETAKYVQGLGLGIVFILLNSTLLPYLQLEQSRKTSTATVIAMLVINIGGDFASVFLFEGKMFGIGLATSLSFFVSVTIAVVKLFGSKLFKFRVSECNIKIVLEICRLGLPDGFMSLCIMFRNRIMNHYVFLYGGAVGMSAISVANSITTAFGNLVQSGYSGSARLVSSVLVGQRDIKSLRDLPRIMIKNVWWIYTAIYAIVFAFSGPLALLFGAESEFIGTYMTVIRLFNLWYFPIIINEPVFSIYQGLGRVSLVTPLRLINIAAPWAICAVLCPIVGLPAAVSITWGADIFTFAFFVIYFTVKTKRLPRLPFELAYIPSSLSAPRENRYVVTVQTFDEAVKASEEVIEFCKTHDIPAKTAYYCGLCVEEMATDTIRNGFKKQGSTIDIRMFIDDGHVRIMLRDTGREFSPIKWLELCKPEETERSVGIKMVSKLADEMNYIHTLGMNVLTISL